VFYIASNPQKHKKPKLMVINGVIGLLALVGGFGLLARMGYSYTAGWIIVKAVAWLFLMALAGMAFKKPKGFVIIGITVALAIALYMVYFRPF